MSLTIMAPIKMLGTLFFTLIFALPVSSISYPFPYPNGLSICDDPVNPPPIINFHVHAIFDGNNRTKSQFALDVYDAFIQYMNPKMEFCPFSHPNPAPFYHDVCFLHFNATMDAFPFHITHLFGGANYAFFIPKEHYLTAEMWWRQNNDPSMMSYLFHTITGCEDKSHTVWTMVNEGYAFNKVNTEGLWCCHNGPANCYCDITQYIHSDGNHFNGNQGEKEKEKKCLTANYEDGSVSLKTCGAMFTDETSWRETFYNDTFIQIENWGTTGPNMPNTYMCLGQDMDTMEKGEDGICTKGSQVHLVSCMTRSDRMNLYQWVKGKIKAINCQEESALCLSYTAKTGDIVLEDCDDAAEFKRLTGHDSN